MANFKIFQDNPDQIRVKIFGSNNLAFNTDSSGNLSITSTGLAITPPTDGLAITSAGLSITPPTNGLAITSAGLSITPPTDGLAITSAGLSITPPTDGLAITSAGLSITPPVGGLAITTSGIPIITAVTDVSNIRTNFTDTAGTPDTTFNVLNIRTWTFGLVNNSLAANAQVYAKLQISPDGDNWIDHDGPITLNQGAVDTLVTTVFLKYARVYYGAVNAASAATLNIFFQGHS